MGAFIPLSAAAQTAFANLQTAAKQAELQRTVADLPGGFTRKTIKDRVYWYYQYKDASGKPVQIYVGPDSAQETRELVDRFNDPGAGVTDKHLRQLSRSAIELGCPSMAPTHARILRRLSDHGFFRAGGILVGTHAFIAYQNMLGVTWGDATTITVDMDFAHPGKNLSIAVPSGLNIDAHGAIESLKMGFLPNNSHTTYTKADEKDLQLDFVTSVGREGDQPVHIDSLNVSLQPLKFMEFSMENVLQTVVITAQGPIVVNVPAPERYALHKLLVALERTTEHRTKTEKDLDQANCLISYFGEMDPGPLVEAHEDLVSRGRGWSSRFAAGTKALLARHPECNLSLLQGERASDRGDVPRG